MTYLFCSEGVGRVLMYFELVCFETVGHTDTTYNTRYIYLPPLRKDIYIYIYYI